MLALLMERPTRRESACGQQARPNCIEIEIFTEDSGCMCGEEIYVEQEIEQAMGRSRTCCSTRWHHGLGVDERDDFGSVPASKFVRQLIMNPWEPSC